MNKTLSTILIVIAVLALAGGIFFVGNIYARANSFGPGWMMSGYGWNNNNVYGPGGMMGGYGYNNNANTTPLTVDQAKAAAEKYLANLNNSGLKITEVMVFNNNAYVVVKETSTGNGAFELLVDPTSQVAYPEFGPNMMWNLKYGGLNHSGMMGGHGGMTLAPGASAGVGNYGNMMSGWNNTTPADVSANMPVTQDQAIKAAQTFLDQNVPGATAATDPIKFYGYYTIDFSKDGKVIGMLSVNGYSGQIFLHTWHGTFVEESAIQ